MEEREHVSVPIIATLVVKPTDDVHFGATVLDRFFAASQDSVHHSSRTLSGRDGPIETQKRQR